MFGLLTQYKLLAGVLVGLVLGGAAGWTGYDYGSGRVQQQWDAERAEVARQTNEALSTLASRFADAERRYEAERSRKARVVTRTVTEVKHALTQLPPRDCALQPAARSLLLRAHCAATSNTTDPECLPESLRPPAEATASGQ